jgi:hypothetical protein
LRLDGDTGNCKDEDEMRGSFPFGKLRVRMTVLNTTVVAMKSV